MNEVNSRLQREAERIAAKRPLPEFYRRFQAPHALAKKLYFSNDLVMHLREKVEPLLSEDFGHGIFHCSRVGIDSATLIFIELESSAVEKSQLHRLMVLGLLAGILHDIRRGEEAHAEAGAIEAKRILKDFPLSPEEVQCISRAIRNHEAFSDTIPCKRPIFQVVSDCLYDADKFRWGMDTFTHTLWHIADQQRLTPQALIERFPWGMTGIYRISDTFRSSTGRQYGPEIIDAGIQVGKEIYRYLMKNYKEGSHGQ